MTFPVDADTFRLHASTSLGDAALQTLLDAAEQAIAIHAGEYIVSSGADDEVNEILTPRGIGPLLRLSRRAQSITTVVEGTETLAADDYELRSSGYVLRRLNDGTNPSLYWRNRVYVTYVPLSDTAERERVQIALVKLDLAYAPGVVQETIGAWSEQKANNSVWNYQQERAAILASLTAEPVGVW